MVGGARALWAGPRRSGWGRVPVGGPRVTVGGARVRVNGAWCTVDPLVQLRSLPFFAWSSHAEVEPRVRVHRSAVVAGSAGHERPLTGGSALECRSVEAEEGGPRKKTFSPGT